MNAKNGVWLMLHGLEHDTICFSVVLGLTQEASNRAIHLGISWKRSTHLI